jgi:tRNA threonylcarbamoyladenosine biosynthesis protein TsaE
MLKSEKTLILADESATIAFGKQLAQCLRPLDPALLIFLKGGLGSGKTTLVRGFLRELQYSGIVKSPTYTLVESYILDDYQLHHFDLYRLTHPEELEFFGAREYFYGRGMAWVEWPERGIGFLSEADLEIEFTLLPKGRSITIRFLSERCSQLATDLQAILS